jgi:hypothetical protein
MNLAITTKNSAVITLNHSIRKIRPNRPTGLSTIDDAVRVAISSQSRQTEINPAQLNFEEIYQYAKRPRNTHRIPWPA